MRSVPENPAFLMISLCNSVISALTRLCLGCARSWGPITHPFPAPHSVGSELPEIGHRGNIYIREMSTWYRSTHSPPPPHLVVLKSQLQNIYQHTLHLQDSSPEAEPLKSRRCVPGLIAYGHWSEDAVTMNLFTPEPRETSRLVFTGWKDVRSHYLI